MTKVYQEVPSNFNQIQNYLTHNKDKVIQLYLQGDIYFFYDTCSLLHHSNASNKSDIIEYLKKHNPTIIITRTVLMELTSNSFQLHPTQISYFQDMHSNGLTVLLFEEEYIVDCLKEASGISNEDANLLLGYAIKEVSKSKGATYQVKTSLETTLKLKILGSAPGSTLLFDTFFRYARSQKTHGDSMAEELMLICIIVLTRIPLGEFVLFSDDLAIRQKVIDTRKYILNHHSVKEPFQLTTTALVYRMYKESIITTKPEILEILSKAFTTNVNVYYLTDRDLELQYSSFPTDKLADNIMNVSDFNVIY